MRFIPVSVEGAYVIELEPVGDERGSFARIWCEQEFADAGLTAHLSQCSISRNTHAATLRGLHYQLYPNEEAKLVRCTRGAIYDVVLDLRPESETYLKWHAVELSPENGSALFIPEGCAHGFQTLTDDSEVLYLISHPYAPESSTGVRWDDPVFGIEWPPAASRTMSEKDRSWPDWPDYDATRAV
jgi:dTDP-4-dehydrorhamnose 3,5-epimerase